MKQRVTFRAIVKNKKTAEKLLRFFRAIVRDNAYGSHVVSRIRPLPGIRSKDGKLYEF